MTIPQYSRADLARMTPHQIVEAKAAGHLEALLSGQDPQGEHHQPQPPAQLCRDDLKSMSPRQIVEAKLAGKLADLLSGIDPTDGPAAA